MQNSKDNLPRFKGFVGRENEQPKKPTNTKIDYYNPLLPKETPFYAKGRFYILILVFAAILYSQFKDKDNSRSSTNSTETRQTIKANCNECGRSFDLENGFRLSGHSQIFCSKGCGERYAFEHGIILTN